jgi:hypothetical protein
MMYSGNAILGVVVLLGTVETSIWIYSAYTNVMNMAGCTVSGLGTTCDTHIGPPDFTIGVYQQAHIYPQAQQTIAIFAVCALIWLGVRMFIAVYSAKTYNSKMGFAPASVPVSTL